MKKIELSDEQVRKGSEILKKYKSYSDFSKNKNDAYSFTKTVGIKICPYCNINYISTIFSDDKEILRPDIDHYFCKSKYPRFQLCLYNLIPSCLTCNERLKGNADFMKVPHAHPYFHDFDSLIHFCVELRQSNDYLDEKNLEITFSPYKNASKSLQNRANNNIETFKLKERYRVHADQVIDLFKKAKFYWKAKKTEISRLLYGNSMELSNWSYSAIERILFPEKDCDINQVSLGKLKKDIINLYCLTK